MTNDQAEAILEAERILQRVGVGQFLGAAWTEYVKEATTIVPCSKCSNQGNTNDE